MSELLHSIHGMPLAGLVPVFMLTVAGVVLWMAGRRLLRGAFMLMGLLVGALIGAIIDSSIGSGLPGWVLPIIAGITLAMIAAMTYRLGAAVMMALVLAIVCPLGVVAVNELQSQRGHGISGDGDELIKVDDSISDWIEKHDNADARDKAKAALQDAKAQVTTRIDDLAAQYGLEDETAAGIAQFKSLGDAFADGLRDQWERTPKRLRPLLSLSSLVGALTGLIIGLVARRFSDCAVTAMVGAALWLGGVHVIAARSAAPDGWWMPKTTLTWMAAWIVASIIGLSIQWARRPRPADKNP